ncbi:serine hydrolase domain-containing protein [Sphingomonas metalli]|nr:serine hydrolase domain-containing protein [Sphingomonas metalli]
MTRLLALLALVAAPVSAAGQTPPPPPVEARIAALEPVFAAWMEAQHVPGLVWGVVKDGRLVFVRGLGVQDLDTRRPVTADSRFRIASMSKAFTAMAILKLADAGRLSLEAPAERYVPEMKGWRYPTSDSRRITVADLLHHDAGFVEDNPWGDRQQPLGEAAFTAMLRAGVPFANGPGVTMEYSNFGYATLGRIVSNVGGAPYQQWIGRQILTPLGMTATGYDVLAGDQTQRALGYRWQDGGWVREPDMADGAFGAMGGLQTTARDYARWVGFLLSAWPARDGAEMGPVGRATVRRIVEGGFVTARDRAAGLEPCRQAASYGMAWFTINDCDLGRVVTHTGGYPGFGSVVMLLPDAGIGIFAFANRTYAAPTLPVMQALLALRREGATPDRAVPVSTGLAAAYDAARTAWRAGDAERAPLAGNVLLDRNAARRRAEIAAAKADAGDCPMTEPVIPVSAMEGYFIWTCAKGKVAGRVQRAPTPVLSLQVLDFRASQP